MLFNSFVFLVLFLPVTYTVFWLLRNAQQRYIWLAITGYVFYGYWNPKFCLLMAFSTLVSYTAGLGFLKYADNARARKLCLVLPVTVDLLLLGFFKYANFALRSIGDLSTLTGHPIAVAHFDIVLPIGISFYTFHTISYIVDSYRKTIKPTRNFFEFAAYVSLFSQLIAGPIVRFRQIESDLDNLGTADRNRWLERGIRFFIIGLVMKVLIADSLAAVVDPALAHYATLSTADAWVAMLGYTFQLLFDFDGYSTMAVGLGFLFGLRIPQNFNSPYKSLDPSDFWKRWHISLSSCLRDYLYISLGGNRNGVWKTYRNLMLTMLIGGLWHGANWTFVVWGGYHGLLLCVHRLFSKQWDAAPALLRRASMFLFAVIGWVFFRSTDFHMAAVMLGRMFSYSSGSSGVVTVGAVALLGFAAVWSMAGPNAFDMDAKWQPNRRHAFALAAAFGACIAIMAGSGSSPFLYFQF
ncbi:MAG TPA: MBOAT family O-acyltransferase [Gemmatimonadaceae bacterium]|nr:MBOAT family O-acyltransferase [Gemmatimonadaceae bacterium]